MSHTKSRRKAREAALKAMYSIEVGRIPLAEAIEHLREESELDQELEAFAVELTTGVHKKWAIIDDLISKYLQDWSLERLATVDRNILRVGSYEILECAEIPPAVSLNEYIEIAKKYSGPESGKFVNGILAKILTESSKANWNADAPESYQEDAPQSDSDDISIEEIEADSPEAVELSKIGMWKLKSGESPE